MKKYLLEKTTSTDNLSRKVISMSYIQQIGNYITED